MIKTITNELLFWLHFLVMVGNFYISLVLAPFIIFVLIALHRLHLKIFKGCVITKIQKLLGGLNENQTFTEKMYLRFFKKEMKRKYIRLGDTIIWAVPVIIAFIRLIVPP